MVSPWNFNWAYNDSPRRCWVASFYDKLYASSIDRTNPWFVLLGKEEWFHELTSKKWVSFASSIRTELTEVREHLVANINDVILAGSKIMDNVDKLINWITRRYDWMDETFVLGQSVTIIPKEY